MEKLRWDVYRGGVVVGLVRGVTGKKKGDAKTSLLEGCTLFQGH